jgi:hypothetical protein
VLDLKDLTLPRTKKEGALPVEEALNESDSVNYVATALDNREDPPGTPAPNETTTLSRRRRRATAARRARSPTASPRKRNAPSAKKSQEESLSGLVR